MNAVLLVADFAPASRIGCGDVFPRSVSDRGNASDAGADRVGPDWFIVPVQKGKKTEAILSAVVGKSDVPDVGEGAEEIRLRHEVRALDSGFDLAGPADDERDTVSALPRVGFVASQRAAGMVSVCFKIFHSDVGGATVVAGEYDECILRDAVLFQSSQNAPDNGISFHDEVGEGIKSASFLPFTIYSERGVRRGEWQVEQERLFGVD